MRGTRNGHDKATYAGALVGAFVGAFGIYFLFPGWYGPVKFLVAISISASLGYCGALVADIWYAHHWDVRQGIKEPSRVGAWSRTVDWGWAGFMFAVLVLLGIAFLAFLDAIN